MIFLPPLECGSSSYRLPPGVHTGMKGGSCCYDHLISVRTAKL